jgi:lysophospholipase L1-like esterase
MDEQDTTTSGTRPGQRAGRGFHRFVAIGDSTTEGMDDPAPAGGYRGWADRLAERLATVEPDFRYANLAVRGRYAAQVRAEQLAPALAMRPDLVSVIAGVNDLLRPQCDLAELIGHLDTMFAATAATGATVLTITQPDPVAVLRMARPVQRRLYAYNEELRASAARHGALVVDFERMPAATHPLFWSVDRLHLNSLGHTRMAATIAGALGLPPVVGDPGVGDGIELPPPPVLNRREALTRDVTWLGEYFAPWAWRYVRGRSSGDRVAAKRPELTAPARQSEDASN